MGEKDKIRIGRLDPEKVSLTLKIDVRELKLRMAIGVALVRLGCWVIGVGVKLEPFDPDGAD